MNVLDQLGFTRPVLKNLLLKVAAIVHADQGGGTLQTNGGARVSSLEKPRTLRTVVPTGGTAQRVLNRSASVSGSQTPIPQDRKEHTMNARLPENYLTDPELFQMTETEEQARRLWDRCPELRQEFSEFSVFWAYLRALQQGQVRICRRPVISQTWPPARAK